MAVMDQSTLACRTADLTGSASARRRMARREPLIRHPGKSANGEGNRGAAWATDDVLRTLSRLLSGPARRDADVGRRVSYTPCDPRLPTLV